MSAREEWLTVLQLLTGEGWVLLVRPDVRIGLRLGGSHCLDWGMATLDLQAMSREEKISIMEAIWADLTHDPEAFESPEWHSRALAEAEESVRDGSAQFRSLSDVKRRINKVVE